MHFAQVVLLSALIAKRADTVATEGRIAMLLRLDQTGISSGYFPAFLIYHAAHNYHSNSNAVRMKGPTALGSFFRIFSPM